MLRVSGLSLRYPNGKLALADFALSVGAGELVAVLGGNGSGKTTLLRCITRTVKPTAGEIWLGDTNLCTLEGEKLRRARLALAMMLLAEKISVSEVARRSGYNSPSAFSAMMRRTLGRAPRELSGPFGPGPDGPA